MTLLKKYWSSILIVLLTIALFISIRSCKQQQSMVQLERNGKDSAFHYATKVELENGEQAFRIKTIEATVHELRGSDVLSELEKGRLKDQVGNLSRAVVFYKGNVEVSRDFGSKATDTVLVEVVRKDTTRTMAKVFDFNNGFLRLHEIYNPRTDSLTRNYLYRVDFQLTAYRKSQGLFKRSQLVTDLTFSDPAIQVGEFTGIVVKEPRKRFYETRGFAIGVGLVGGVWVSSKLK